jgi:hypothetical protein
MAQIGRHPVAAVLGFFVVGLVVVFGAFLLLVRSSDSGPDPKRDAALAMAHRLLTGRESLATDREGAGQYVFRVAYQASDASVGSTEFATHIGVAVCLGDSRAISAACFSYLHRRTAGVGAASSSRAPTRRTSRARAASADGSLSLTTAARWGSRASRSAARGPAAS